MVKRNMLNVFSNLLCYIFLATYYYFAYSYKIKYLFTIYLMVINCLAHFSYNMVRWGFRSYTTNLKIYLSFWFAHIKSHQILFYLAKQLKWKIKFLWEKILALLQNKIHNEEENVWMKFHCLLWKSTMKPSITGDNW